MKLSKDAIISMVLILAGSVCIGIGAGSGWIGTGAFLIAFALYHQ